MNDELKNFRSEVKVDLYLEQAVEAHRVVRRRGSHVL
jgi:hypothetical protein